MAEVELEDGVTVEAPREGEEEEGVGVRVRTPLDPNS